MRRAISICLLVLIGFTVAAPLFARDPEANLPACCRRNGQHHCMMRWMVEAREGKPGLTAAREKCPCFPSHASAARTPVFWLRTHAPVPAEAARRAGVAAQPSARRLLALSHSKPKRGPPPVFI